MNNTSVLPSVEEFLETNYILVEILNGDIEVIGNGYFKKDVIDAMTEFAELVRNATLEEAAKDAEKFLKDQGREFWGDMEGEAIRRLKYDETLKVH